MDTFFSTLYVSSLCGDDSFVGTLPSSDGKGNGPLKTIEYALSVIAKCRQSGIDRPMYVSLVDDYFTSSAIRIVGVNGVTIESYQAPKRIIGGVQIDGWRYGEFNGKKCLCAPVPNGVKADFTDLYINGERAHITRFPKKGKLKIADADRALREGHTHSDHVLSSSKWFRVYPEDLSGLDKIEDAMIHYDHYWIDEHSPIESYDPESGKLVMTYTSRFSVGVNYDENPNASPLYYLTNIPNCFGEAGSWYLDRDARTVYYMPQSNAATPEQIKAFAPVTQRLFLISGEDVHLHNLELTCSSGDYASVLRYKSSPPDVNLFASDIQSCFAAPGAISFQAANRCSITNCVIHGVGIYGVDVTDGSKHIRMENNHLYDICAGGIRIAGFKTEECPTNVSDCVIRRNHIHDCGVRYLAGCGILLMDANTCEISENEIHDLEYSGISAGWVWGYGDSDTYGNTIKANHIYRIGKGNLSDLGAIYLLGKQQGTVVAQNLIHDVKCYSYGAWGIYLDEGSSYITVEKNIIYHTERESFHLNYGSYNTIRNNLFLGGKASCVRIGKAEAHDQLLVEQNLFVTENAPMYGSLSGGPVNMHADHNIFLDTQCNSPLLWKSRDEKLYDHSAWKSEFGNDQASCFADSYAHALAMFGVEKLDCFVQRGIDLNEVLNRAIEA